MATSLTLRSVKGSALSHTEMDTNLQNLAATADAALPASAATPVTDFKDTPTEFDETMIFDNAAGGAMKRAFLGDMPAAGGGYSTASQVRNALETLTDTNRLDASAVKNLPTLSPGDPVTVSHDGAGENPVVGDTLTANFATGWSGSVQWLRDGSPIGGATSATYLLVEADEETVVRPEITALEFLAVGVTVALPADTAPAAFTVGQWTLTAIAGGLRFGITALPDDGGSAITDLERSTNNGSSWASLGGTTTGNYDVTGLAETEFECMVRAVNAIGNGANSDMKAETPDPAATAPTIVQIAAPTPTYAEDHVMTFGVTTTATRTIVVKVAAATSSGVPTVAGSDAVSFGSEIFSYAYDGQTYRFFRLANAAALTSVTATFAGGTGADVVAYEVAGLGSAPVLDDTFEASYTSNATTWEYDVVPTVDGTVFFGHAAFTNATTVASSNAPMVADEHAPSDNYSVHCHAELSADGAQTLSYVIADERQGGRAGIVLRPGT